jgi:hypothetical protein
VTQSKSERHPVALVVDDDLHRNRFTVLIRYLLVIPQSLWLLVWGILIAFVWIAAWLAALVKGRVPDTLHGWMAQYLRATTHVNAYIFLLANPWPPFTGDGWYPVDVRIDPPEPQNRLTILFRMILAIPAFVLSYAFRQVNSLIAFVAWFYCIAMGRMSKGMRDVSAWMLQYEIQTYAYATLLTARYPSFAGGPQS